MNERTIDDRLIAVAGATGNIGRPLVRELVARGAHVRALVRDSSRSAAMARAGVQVVAADLTSPTDLRAALDGVKRAFLVAPDIGAEEKLAMEANFIDAAVDAGVCHLVYVSVVGLGTGDEFALRRWHEETERRIEAAGLAFTHLRPVAFMSNLFLSADTIKAEGAFYLPTGDGRVAVIDPADIAAVAATALTEDGHEGRSYTLTGAEALSYAEQAGELTEALGRPIRFVDVPEDAAREAMRGLAEDLIEALLEFYALVKAGRRELIATDFQQVMGREPRSFGAWAQEHADTLGPAKTAV